MDCELELVGTMHGFSISTNFSPVNVVLLLFAGSVHPERGTTTARITINVANLCKSNTLSTTIQLIGGFILTQREYTHNDFKRTSNGFYEGALNSIW